MAIIFHCPSCGKEIKAADNAGGKWGKCPKCHNKIYVPSIDPEKEEPELKLAPVDEPTVPLIYRIRNKPHPFYKHHY